MCIYNLFACNYRQPQTMIKREKEEVKSCCIFFSLSHGPTQFYYSRWGNLRALTKWESIIRTFQSSVVPSSATQLNLFFFFSLVYMAWIFITMATALLASTVSSGLPIKKKNPTTFYSTWILFPLSHVKVHHQRVTSIAIGSANGLLVESFFFFLSCVLQPDLPYGRAVGCCCWTQEPSRKYLKESRQS